MNPGDRFGDYTVVRLLGKGGMGAVYLLESAEGVQVAAKILDPATAGDHESRRRFVREAELALGVRHPNLIETYDVGEDPETGLCYILMEYVSGGSLADYLKENGALPVEDAVAVVEAMAQVLELARGKGIVHRDIKPANIMFDAEGTPKLADLGIARGGHLGTETTTVTQTGMMIGTPAYMAPEQMLDAHNVDTRADIYSLGVVFFEMLTGERPNKDDTVVQLMAKAVKGEPLPDVRTLRPEVSASLAQLLAMMVVPDKDGRIATPGQITNALGIIERGGTFESDSVKAHRREKLRALRRQRKRRRQIVLISVLSAVALVGLAGIGLGVNRLVRDEEPVSQGGVKAPSKPAEPVPQVIRETVVVTNTVEKKVVQIRTVTNVTERIVEKKEEAQPTVVKTTVSKLERGKSQSWRPGPNAKWFVSWDEALADARERGRPILVLNTGSTWCHWCKKLRAEVLDQDVFKAFANEHLTLLCLDSPCENVDQRNHNKQVVKALKFNGGVPNVRVFTGSGKLLGSVSGGGLAVEAYVGKLREILANEGEDRLEADGRMLFADGYAALAAKIAEERAKLPKVFKEDFKAKLVGVAVVDSDNRSLWNLKCDFLPPETHIEVPFGKTALFKVEYDFPEGYQARVWTRDEWPSNLQGNRRFFGSNPSGFYKGKGVTTGFLLLNNRGRECNLKSLAIRTSSDPEIDDETREWKIGSFPVDIVFKEKKGGTSEDESQARECSTPPGWLDDLEAAKEQAKRERKLILAAFEGSDWCGWCKKMEKDVYTQSEFMPTVSPRFVPVYIDSPRNRTLLREAVRERNPALHGEYGIRGVPCVVILDAEGKELGRAGGYKKNVDALMEKINAIPGVPREKVRTAGGLVDPEDLKDPDSTRATQKAFDALFPGWKVSAVEQGDAEWTFGYQASWRGRKNVIATMPPSLENPTVISRDLKIGQGHPVLNLEVASQNVDVDFLLSVRVNGKTVLEPRLICTPEDVPYAHIQVPLSAYAGKRARIEIVHAANNWFYEHAFWGEIEIAEGTGQETAGLVGVKQTLVFPAANLSDSKWRRRSYWRYTEKSPGADWMTASFDDSQWRKSVKAFGRDAGKLMAVAEPWRKDRIWLRRTFTWVADQPVYNAVFNLHFDQDVEIFLNGTLVLKRDGWNAGWDLHAADRAAFAGVLRQGENVLAVTLKGEGASFFDCGLSIETQFGTVSSRTTPGAGPIGRKQR